MVRLCEQCDVTGPVVAVAGGALSGEFASVSVPGKGETAVSYGEGSATVRHRRMKNGLMLFVR